LYPIGYIRQKVNNALNDEKPAVPYTPARPDPSSLVEASQLAERDVPDFLEVDHSKMTAKFARIPALSDVPFSVQMEPHLIVEFYSR
jgi:small subunit ribosomal protein S4